MLEANRMAWIRDKDNDIEGLKPALMDTVDMAVGAIIVVALPTEENEGLPAGLRQIKVAHMIDVIEEKFVGKSEAKQEEL